MRIPDSHIILNSNEILHTYCEPLFTNTEINHFVYTRHYFNGDFFTLNSKGPLLINKITKAQCYPTNHELENYHKFSRYLYLDIDFNKKNLLFNATKKWEKNFEIQKSFSLTERFYIIEKTPNYFNLYGFSCGDSNKKSLSFYIENLNILESYIKYFNFVGKDLLNDCDKQKILLDHYRTNNASVDLHDTKKIFLNNLNSFINENHNNNLIINNTKITLSEKRCLNLIYKGLTSKEVARELNISYRTVEQHITNIKNKFNCKYTKQLIYLLKDNELLLS